jgi:hypothetical protein
MGELIGAFKTVSTKGVNASPASPGHPYGSRATTSMDSTEAELGRDREYIDLNPLMWALDEENPL